MGIKRRKLFLITIVLFFFFLGLPFADAYFYSGDGYYDDYYDYDYYDYYDDDYYDDYYSSYGGEYYEEYYEEYWEDYYVSESYYPSRCPSPECPAPAPQCPPSVPENDPVSGSLSVSTTNVYTGESFTLTISGQDDNGLSKACLQDNTPPYSVFGEGCKQMSGISDSKCWQIVKSEPGSYSFCGEVYGFAYDSCSSHRDEESALTNCQTVNVTERTTPLNISCSASPYPAEIDQRVTFRASASGGTGSYNYYWSGDCTGSSYSCETYFSYSGRYRTTVTITSGNQTASASCSVQVEGLDECSVQGETRCYDSTRKQTCGNYDSDSYLEWSSSQSCRGNTSCGFGRCEEDERPDWYCSGEKCRYRCESDSDCEEEKCECSKGPCCDGCDYKSSSTSCDVELQTQYACPWGSSCGADVAKRTRTKIRYCSGSSAKCTGKWDDWLKWSNWTVADYCSANEVCRSGNSQCQYSSACVQPPPPSPPTYIKNFRRYCYDNDIYWFDSNGVRQGKHLECSDENECTLDGCENDACFNNLECDGTTCELDSSDYCQNCEHCGDDSCNCDENVCECPIDCERAEVEEPEPEPELEPEKGAAAAALALTLKSLAKKWYVWLLLWIVFVVLLYTIFKRRQS